MILNSNNILEIVGMVHYRTLLIFLSLNICILVVFFIILYSTLKLKYIGGWDMLQD